MVFPPPQYGQTHLTGAGVQMKWNTDGEVLHEFVPLLWEGTESLLRTEQNLFAHIILIGLIRSCKHTYASQLGCEHQVVSCGSDPHPSENDDVDELQEQ